MITGTRSTVSQMCFEVAVEKDGNVNKHIFARQNSLFRFTEVPKVSDQNNDNAPPSLNEREEDNCLFRKKAHAAMFAFRGTAIYYGS
jgi:hypothetical protein